MTTFAVATTTLVTITATYNGASLTAQLTVNAPNGVPTITSLSPSSALAGAAAQTLTINGTNFLSTSTVTYNGGAHTAAFVDATHLTIPLTTGDQATAGLYPVVVTNPAPGGGRFEPVQLHGEQSGADRHEPFSVFGQCRGSGADGDHHWHELPFHFNGHLQRAWRIPRCLWTRRT